MITEVYGGTDQSAHIRDITSVLFDNNKFDESQSSSRYSETNQNNPFYRIKNKREETQSDDVFNITSVCFFVTRPGHSCFD